ncbi:pitrilysin family protein [Psychrobacter sp.]|uniref:M16 family metallopeptidase n=1 Tax=Psychrobacter sp. TaxID=56811 RepID=UPI0025D66186|nr:pitrilysin family protein [Psychrobacter sp.]
MKSHSRLFCSLTTFSLKPIVVVSSIITTVGLTTLGANAAPEMPNGEHANTDVDITQPIKAINNLSSLKSDQKLDFTIPKFQHFTTSNGIPVIFFQTNQLPIVDIDLRFNAGSARDETIRKNSFGLASMVADLLTKGTKQLDETAFAEATEQLGIELGSAAYKDQFVINLRSLSATDKLNPALKLLNDVLNEPRFDAKILERSKAQQILGIRQMMQNPSYLASINFNQALYGSHPYAHPSYGTAESIPSINTNDLQRFHDTYLVAKNASLSITGDLSLDQAKQAAETITQALPQGKPAPQLPMPTPINHSKWIHINYDSDQTSVIMGQQGYSVSSDPSALEHSSNFSIGNEILAGSGFNSRLMGKVRKEMGYTYGIYGNMTAMQVSGPYSISFSTRNEKADEAIKATLQTVNDTLKQGVTSEEFKLTQESLINSYPMGFSSNKSINGMLGAVNFNKLPDSYITDYTRRLENSNVQQVNKALQDTLTPDKFIIVTVGKPDIAKDSELNKLK